MRTLSKARRDLIESVVAESSQTGISAGLLEKDEHLSDALAAIFNMRHDEVELVFCGGSSLSKAHGLIERMSEDADFKMVLSPALTALPGAQIRKALSRLKKTIASVLTDIGFEEDPDGQHALNGNRYFASAWRYESAYRSPIGLRPHLQVEFTARTPVLPCLRLPVHRLADRLANLQPTTVLSAPTVALAETLAEKVLSFLRRYEQHHQGQMERNWDPALVRHIYDVHCIITQQPSLHADAALAFPQLLDTDMREFGKQFLPLAEDPVKVLEGALSRIGDDEKVQAEYETHLLPLVYGDRRPAFREAFASFRSMAMPLIDTVRRQ